MLDSDAVAELRELVEEEDAVRREGAAMFLEGAAVAPTLHRQMSNFVENVAACLLTSPLFLLAYWAFFLRRLPPEERDIVREARRSEEIRRWRATQACVAGAVVLATSSSAPDAPFGALVVAWTVTWPLIALALAGWSLRIRRRDHVLWSESLRGRSVDPLRLVLLVFAALIPGVMITMIFAKPSWE